MPHPTAALPRTGFVARNLFQAAQLAPLARAMGGRLLAKPALLPALAARYPELAPLPLKAGLRDGAFAVLVAHGPFTGLERLRQTRVAMVQYGYAKSPYNFGPWRALADLNLVYGPWAAKAVEHMAPQRIVGHPQALEAARAPEAGKGTKPVLLYAPTWGTLSSIGLWAEELSALGAQYQLLLKPHHNTVAREPALMAQLQAGGGRLAAPEASLMALIAEADLVLSDYSGAIFEAILARRPVVLLDTSPDVLAREPKLDAQSLEIAHRAELGLVAQKGQLRAAVEQALAGGTGAQMERSALFAEVADPMQAMVQALCDLAAGKITPSATQAQAQAQARRKLRRKAWLKGIALLAALGGVALLGVALVGALL